MGSLGIRAATLLDAPRLAQVHNLCWRQTYTGILPEDVIAQKEASSSQMWTDLLADPGSSAIWVATWDSQIVGFVIASALGPGQARLLEVRGCYVLEDYHRRGVATRLLTHAIGDAPAQLWVFADNCGARAFYESLGFSYDGADDYSERYGGIRAVRMIR